MDREFWDNVEIRDRKECWEWKKEKTNKYCTFKYQFIHWYVFTAFNGKNYPERINGFRTCVRHICSNRRCCNPYHLRFGTYRDNMKDRARARRVPDYLIRAIRLLRRKGISYREIVDQLGLNKKSRYAGISTVVHACKKIGVYSEIK
jgi:hypothetical protein